MRNLALRLISLYQMMSHALHWLSHLFGYPAQCRFPISCSEYCRDQFSDNPDFVDAVCRCVKRLLSCGPWSSVWNFIRALARSVKKNRLVVGKG